MLTATETTTSVIASIRFAPDGNTATITAEGG
jgi:hypothetical protein